MTTPDEVEKLAREMRMIWFGRASRQWALVPETEKHIWRDMARVELKRMRAMG